MDVPECLIYEYDADDDALVMRSLYERMGPGRVRAARRAAAAGRLAQRPAHPLRPGDGRGARRATTRWTRRRATAMLENGELSALSVPLWFEGEPLGILVLVETRDDRRFSEHEFELARGLGEQAAVAIHNAHLYRRLETAEQHAQRPSRLEPRAHLHGRRSRRCCTRLAAVAAEALRAPSCYIYEYDAPGRRDPLAVRVPRAIPSIAIPTRPAPLPARRLPVGPRGPRERPDAPVHGRRPDPVDRAEGQHARLGRARDAHRAAALRRPDSGHDGDRRVPARALVRHRRDRARPRSRRAGRGGDPQRPALSPGDAGATSVSSRCSTSAAR